MSALQEPLAVDQREAARRLGVSERTVFNLRASGRLPFVKLGRQVRFLVGDLRRFLEAHRQGEAAS
jgi:excisionase family DNA binding protein